MQIDFSEGQRENRSLSKSTCIVKYLYRQIPKRSAAIDKKPFR